MTASVIGGRNWDKALLAVRRRLSEIVRQAEEIRSDPASAADRALQIAFLCAGASTSLDELVSIAETQSG